MSKVPEIIYGHYKGYITDGDITNGPVDAVHGCDNMDFYQGYDQRRKPIALRYDLDGVLPEDYKIIAYREKRIIDIDGNSKDAVLAAAKDPEDAESELKLYLRGYFCPSEASENSYKPSGFGWNDDVIELTERVTGAIRNVSDTTAASCTFEIEDSSGLFSDDDGYYKGFFVYRNTSNAKNYVVIGLITDYSKAGSTCTFTIKRRSYIATEDPYTRYIPELEDDDELILARFPVNFLNMNNWKNVEDIDIQEGYNHFTLSCGHNSRPVWIGFIANRTYFSGGFYADESITFSGTSTNDMEFSGTYTGRDERNFKVQVVSSGLIGGILYLNAWKWQREGDAGWSGNIQMTGNWVSLGDGIQVRFGNYTAVHGVGDNWTITIDGSDTGKVNWNGFWMSYLSPAAENKKVYRMYHQPTSGAKHVIIDDKTIGAELGVDYHFKVDSAVGDYHRQRYFSFGLTLNGFETIFIKNLYLQCIIQGANYIIYVQEPNINFNVDFDRRITGTNIFYSENSTNAPGVFQDTPTRDNEFPATYQVQRDRGGHVPVDGSLIACSFDSSYNVNKLDFMFHENGQYNAETTLYLNKINTGISLNSMLNNYYWKDINLKFKYVTRVGKYLLAANLSNSSIKDLMAEGITNISEDGRGSVCLAQFENGNTVCNSLFVSERIRQITHGEEILGIAGFQNNQALIFTFSKMYYLEILDFGKFTFKVTVFDSRGLVNRKSLAAAQILDEFGGIYWVNPGEGIFGFVNGRPVDLLENKWQLEYQRLSTGIKNSAISGFFPDLREIYFYFNSKLYIYSLKAGHWKIHTYPVAPEIFEKSLNGLITFSAGRKIYQREPLNSDQYLDLGTTAINFYTEQYISFKSTSMHKILHNADIHIDVTPHINAGEPLATYVYLRASTEKTGSNDLMNHKLDTNSSKLFNRLAIGRKHVSYVKLVIQSDSVTAGNIEDITRREVILKAIPVPKFTTKE